MSNNKIELPERNTHITRYFFSLSVGLPNSLMAVVGISTWHYGIFNNNVKSDRWKSISQDLIQNYINHITRHFFSLSVGLQTLLNFIVWLAIPGVILISKNIVFNTLQNWIHSLLKDFEVCQNIICNGAPKFLRLLACFNGRTYMKSY